MLALQSIETKQPSPRVARAAMSSDGECMVMSDGDVVRLAGGRTLMHADAVIAVAVLDRAVWLVTRDPDGHTLHRFHPSGAPTAPPTPLGPLGDDVTIAVNRIGARVALIEGERAVLVREREGKLSVEALGERRRDRRVLVGARGVAERVGSTVKLRTGSVPPLAVPLDLCSYAIGAAAVVSDGNALLVELFTHDAAAVLVYDLRSGDIAKRIRLGALRVLTIAERAGVVVLGRGTHIALLDLRAGRCVSEHILASSPLGCTIDATGTKVMVLDADGSFRELDRSTPASVPTEPEPPPDLAPAPEPEPEPEPAPPPAPPAALVLTPAVCSEIVDDHALEALGESPEAVLSGDAIVSYLDDVRTWIESMCATALAAQGEDAPAIEAARLRERGAAEAFGQWNRPGAPHFEIGRELGLSPLATTLLWIVAAPQIWGELARNYAQCTADVARPLVDELLVAHILEANVAMRSAIARELDDDAPLVRSGAIAVARTLRPYASLSAHPLIARRLAGAAFEAATDTIALRDFIGPRAAIGRLAETLREHRPAPARIVIRGRRGSGRRTLAAALAKLASRSIGVVSVGDVATLRARLHAVSLRGQIPCIDLEDVSEEPRSALRAVLEDHVGPLFVRALPDGELPLAPGYDSIELPPLTETERRAAWEAQGVASDVATTLASRFIVGAGAIVRAARDGGDAAQLAARLRTYRSARIATIAERLDDLATWQELVVSSDIEDALRELVARVRHRRMVLETWGLSRVAATARGVTALFQGGPGTGKTMAAGVIAATLGYELWRVDLSKVQSKWIGETEKNLAAVFDAAEEGEIVLLFDEADSLFSKRTDVRSSNDKHSNVATNYLLQRLDSFSGVAVLTTNFGSAIDPAFKRRISVNVQFPFPDEDDRERLWRAHLPSTVPTTGDLGLATLARQYQLSGGYIRNAVLRAAYLAADGDGAITAQHLIRAVTLEKERVGKLGDGRFD